LELGGVSETIEPENGRRGGVKHRIALWASAGFVVACGWAVYALAVGPIPIISEPPLLTLAKLTCPIVLAVFYFDFGVRFYWIILTNAAPYALVGFVLEAVRQRLHLANRFTTTHAR
jgi:hypothetical protein